MTNAAPTLAQPDDGRKQSRTHLMVAATLYHGERSKPVVVRNISAHGALVEGQDIPAPSSPIMLRRGRLQARGHIAWSNGQKAGLAFTTSVHIPEWMSRVPGRDQDKIDAIVVDFKQGRLQPAATVVGASEGGDLKQELKLLRDELAHLGNSLIGDVILVATHPEIQSLDISIQRIDRLLNRLSDG